ncbi:hypothetical protein [Pandoraea pnomenusa]|uniref:hypothetical protein n=1 Tax=Pandoraea pnomenusa TaxID=93220 RepID=UPI0011C0475D|nr:hypothetical protein [Pandoraea pnomenusa]
MKRFAMLAACAAMLSCALAACSTTAQSVPSPSQVAARVCPPVEVAIASLQQVSGMSNGALQSLAEAQPVVNAVCAAGSTVDAGESSVARERRAAGYHRRREGVAAVGTGSGSNRDGGDDRANFARGCDRRVAARRRDWRRGEMSRFLTRLVIENATAATTAGGGWWRTCSINRMS